MSTLSLQDGMRAQVVAQPLLHSEHDALYLPQEPYQPLSEADVLEANNEEHHREAERKILALQAECDKLEKVGSSFMIFTPTSSQFYRSVTYFPHTYRPHTYCPRPTR